MIFMRRTNALTKEDTTVPGVVLAVSPDSTTVVIADQVRQVIYLYTVSLGRAHLDRRPRHPRPVQPRRQDPLPHRAVISLLVHVHNTNSGWSVYRTCLPEIRGRQACNLNNNNYTSTTTPFTPFCSPDLAVTIPSEGAFLSGPDTPAPIASARTPQPLHLSIIPARSRRRPPCPRPITSPRPPTASISSEQTRPPSPISILEHHDGVTVPGVPVEQRSR